MARRYDIITFDCYGTLIDWEGGISAAFAAEAARVGARIERAAVLAAHAEFEPLVQAEAYRSYRDVLTETARRMAPRLGLPLTDDRARFLADSLPSWPAFPDTNAALERLHAAGYRLGILSNTDADLLAATRRHFTVPFDLIVTAQQTGSYKPAHRHWHVAAEEIRDAPWLHAAQSYFHDVVPARALGLPVAWVNRHGEAPSGEARPDYEVRDLAGLADVLTTDA